MKAFLVYPDRDFDPSQLLVRREKELGWRHADQKQLDLAPMLPWNEAALTQDLGLQAVFEAMAQGDKFMFEVAKVVLLRGTTDLDVVRFRQRNFSDCLRQANVIRDLYQLAIDTIKQQHEHYLGFYARYPSGVLHWSIEVMQLLVGQLKKLRKVAERHAADFQSDGFMRLFTMLRDELSDSYFAEIEEHLVRLQFRRGVVISAELGKGNIGENYVLRRPHEPEGNWLTRLFAESPPSYSFQLHPRDENGARALSELRDRGVNLVANALGQSVDHVMGFFQMLRTELAFYIGCLNLHAELSGHGAPLCVPTAHLRGCRRLSFNGLYDPALALNAKKRVVGNDLDADHKSLCVVTGANTGGKSTFLRSIGIAQLMMQAGMFVAADSFSSEVCHGVFTHYKREEDAGMESGKWDEELGRMSAIVDHVGPHSLMLFNESFASTNEREGSEIADQIVRALLDRNVKVFFVTHLYHFASGFAATKSGNAVFLRAERRPDGTRSFKLIEGAPLQTSYGDDLYRQIFGEHQAAQRHCAA